MESSHEYTQIQTHSHSGDVRGAGRHPPQAGGHNAGQLQRAGWFCYNTSPHDWIHCLDLDKVLDAKPSLPVKVFSTDGEEFLGTELLLHQDVYAGQPCPQDDMDLWGISADAPDYMACHHFLTAH